jgi:hypothetical protein
VRILDLAPPETGVRMNWPRGSKVSRHRSNRGRRSADSSDPACHEHESRLVDGAHAAGERRESHWRAEVDDDAGGPALSGLHGSPALPDGEPRFAHSAGQSTRGSLARAGAACPAPAGKTARRRAAPEPPLPRRTDLVRLALMRSRKRHRVGQAGAGAEGERRRAIGILRVREVNESPETGRGSTPVC